MSEEEDVSMLKDFETQLDVMWVIKPLLLVNSMTKVISMNNLV